jgi:PAS domain S-box-containing protein
VDSPEYPPDVEQFRLILDCAPDAILIVDENDRIVLVNDHAEKLFGYNSGELIGRRVEELVSEDARPAHAQLRQAYLEHPSKRDMGSQTELKALRKNGECFPIEVALNRIRTSRGDWMAAGVRDLTERKLAEERLIAERRRAEEGSRTKSVFLAAMSHEIRTPMNSILGMADLLWETELTAEQRQYVEVFRRAGANLLALIDDILDFSKIESGRLALERVEFDLEEVVDQVVELVGLKARSKNLPLMSRILPGTVTSLIGDPTRLRQILINLMGNAVKFTHSGKVLLTIENAESGHPGEIAFAVSDTGIGIPSDKLNSIFDQFTQADSSITREYGGTGLGLAISQRLVESMGGKLGVSSKLGEGSTFSFTAQFDLGRVAAREEARDLEDLHGRRVLIVDDNPANCLILREGLKAWGMDAHSLERLDEAFADIGRSIRSGEEYTLVILDKQMPQADGFEAAEQIWRLAPHLPIVLLSSTAASGDFTRAIKAGFAGYAVKPVKRTDLFRLVCQAMKASPRLTAAAGATVKAPTTPPTAGLKILIVEDSEDNRLLIDRYLKESRYEITFAADGLQGVEEFNRGRFDLILMDLQMPRMDGLTATRTIRKMEAEQNLAATPIIALSANARPEDIALSRKLGCNDHLSKPISKARLLAAIQEYSRNHAISGLPAQSQSAPAQTAPQQLAVDADAMNYLARRKSEIESLRALLVALEFDKIRIAGHNMKGSGGGYGFPKLTELGAAIESAAKRKDPGAVDNKLSDLALYLEEVFKNSPDIAAIH